MAKPTNATAADIAQTASIQSEEWIEDIRSLPMYNVRECSGCIQGYLVDAHILQASGDEDRNSDNKAFMALILHLTKPCKAMLNGERVQVEAGKEIYVHGAALDDLDGVALNKDEVIEYILEPIVDPETKQVKQVKLKSGFNMPLWKRVRRPTGKPRKEITVRMPSFSRSSELKTMLSQAKHHGVHSLTGGIDVSFEPKELNA